MLNDRTSGFVWGLVKLGVRETVAPLQNQAFGTSGFLGCKPTNVNIEIINRCCLRCQMCDIWKNHPEGELSIREWKQVVDSLKAWLGSFRLTITGGEPFMKVGIWDFLEYCVDIDLPVVVITNGFGFTAKQLEQLAALRLTQVVISLDSLNPETHDKIRGMPGAHKKTWKAMNYLAANQRPFLLGSSTVIMDDNILELGSIAYRFGEIGIDRIFFQPVQGGFTTSDGLNWPYDTSLWPSSADRIEEGFSSLLEAKKQGVPIANSVRELLFFRDYFLQGPQWVRPWPCTVGYTTFHCDAFGQVRMCIPYAGNIGNIRTHQPAYIWNNAIASRERSVISSCERACMLNCNRKYTVGEKIAYGKNLLSKPIEPSRHNNTKS